MATRARLDAARRAQAAADLALWESGVRLPAKYRAAKSVFDMLSPATINNDVAAASWTELFELSERSKRDNGQAAMLGTAEDRREALGGVAAPCRVIAFADDLITPACLGAEVADAIPSCDFIEIPNCGHLGFLERPDEVNAAIIQFLGKH
jgi:pimeloyl-ACP methyl ester carboxylesterase